MTKHASEIQLELSKVTIPHVAEHNNNILQGLSRIAYDIFNNTKESCKQYPELLIRRQIPGNYWCRIFVYFQNTILTAAHCVYWATSFPEEVTVYAGMRDRIAGDYKQVRVRVARWSRPIPTEQRIVKVLLTSVVR